MKLSARYPSAVISTKPAGRSPSGWNTAPAASVNANDRSRQAPIRSLVTPRYNPTVEPPSTLRNAPVT